MEKMGQNFGQYEVQEEVGRGAMGIVYRAVDRKIGRDVALKTIKMSDLGEGPARAQLQERLRREARAAGILSHPRIVTIYDYVEHENFTYIVMEFVNGPTLLQKLAQEGHVPAQEVGDIIMQSAQGLDYAHKRGVVHRDIKPANIMIDQDSGEVKITDFGVAKIFKDQSMTQAGTMMGTPFYMAPEQIMAQPLTGCADQFSLAVIAYELLAGQRPFDAETLPGLIHQILNLPPPRCERLDKEFGPAVCGVLNRALSKKPEDRFPSCVAFADALRETLAGREPGELTRLMTASERAAARAPRQPPAPAPRLFNWKLTIGVSALVAIFAATLAYYLSNQRTVVDPEPLKKDVTEPLKPVDKPADPPLIANQNPPPVNPPANSGGTKPKSGDEKTAGEKKTGTQVAVNKQPEVAAPPVQTPVSNPPVQTPPPVVETPVAPSGEYGTRRAGEFTWTGSLAVGDTLRIRMNQVQHGGGALASDSNVLKGVKPVDVTEMVPGEGLNVLERPNETNQWTTVAVKNESDHPISSITFRWRLRR